MMNIEEALEYIRELDKKGIVMGLKNMRKLMSVLGNPQNEVPHIIHIAGTNGKGSVGAFIEAALLSAGFSAGRYSSPAVFSRYEVFRKNGANITEQEYCILAQTIKSASEKAGVELTAFEAETAMAFLFVKDCQYCIMEAGLGGRLDATNIIDSPKIAVITTISLDHMNILGNTIEDITAEKCGIIHQNTKVISAVQCPEAESIIKKYNAVFVQEPLNIHFMNEYQTFDYKNMKDIRIGLLGRFQPLNAAVAIETLKILGIREKYIRTGLARTVWHGRFDIISREPLIIADGAHNTDAFLNLKMSLDEYFPGQKFTFITGVLKDKEYTEAAKIFAPCAKMVFTITPDNPRALDADEYAEEFVKNGADAQSSTIRDTIKNIDKNGITIAFGSLSFMRDLFEEVKNG